MKRERGSGSTHKAEGVLYYKCLNSHHCQKQTAECPITPILTPRFNFPASDLAKERKVQWQKFHEMQQKLFTTMEK